MFLQKGIDPHTGKIIWLILDEKYQIIEPIQRFLSHFSKKSPNTVESYGHDLKALWRFLQYKHLDWRNIKPIDLVDFSYWLAIGECDQSELPQAASAIRAEKSVDRILNTTKRFYKYCGVFGLVDRGVSDLLFDTPIDSGTGFLKPGRDFPGCLSRNEIETLIDACSRLRDKLLIAAFDGTGARRSEVLGLCHEDFNTSDKSIRIVRRNNPNGARAKGHERTIPVSPDLLRIYNDYLIHEYPPVNSDYVFINIWEGEIGAPMKPAVINTMFERLSSKTGIYVYPHLIRHTHATELILSGMPIDRVSYRLGHKSVSTTQDIYSHACRERDLRKLAEHKQEN